MTYPAYEKYKESGVPWLGKVPEGWDTWKMTHGFDLIGSGTTPRSDNLGFYDGDIPWVTTSELRETLIVDTEKKLTDEAFADTPSLRYYDKGALLIAMYGATIGRLGILGIKATVNQACCVFDKPKEFDSKFVFWWLQMAKPTLLSLSSGGGQPNLSQDALKQLRLTVPKIPEQKAIADFLDKKTAEIDALIAKKEELLKLLAEQRTALITHAVTKGLNPSAPMKDSGIDWLGSIPQHWHAKRLKFAVRLVNDKIEAASFDLAYMGLEQIESWTGKRIPNEEAISEGVVNVFQPNDVLFGKLRPYLAKVYLAKENATCSTEAFVLRSSKQLLPDFLQLYMLTDKFINAVDATTYGAKMPRANWESVGNLMMLLPPLKEQETIVEHVHTNIRRIEAVSNQVVEAIDRLKEYRTALITNAVTGKIKVV